MHSRGAQARRSNAVLGRSERTQKPWNGRGALAQGNRRSVSKNAPLKDDLNKTILARRSGVENHRHLPRLNFGHVDNFGKKWLERPKPDRFRNRLRRCHARGLQILATRQITAPVPVLGLGRMLVLRMHRTLRTYSAFRQNRGCRKSAVITGHKPCRHRRGYHETPNDF